MELDLLIYIHHLKIKEEQNTRTVWDLIRKKWVALTPEEMIRQLFIYYIIEKKGVSKSLINVEKEIKLGQKIKRCDIIVFDGHHRPDWIIECKTPDIVLDAKVVAQIVRYNLSLQANWLGIVNGKQYLEFGKHTDGKYYVLNSMYGSNSFL